MKVLILLLLFAAPAFAQGRDTLKGNIQGIDVIRELAEQYPQEWRCAHVETGPCDPYAFVKIVASYIYYELQDTRVGLNRRRGDGALSWDALAILDPSGDTSDINGGRSFVIDFCGGCGTGNHNPQWSSVGGRSGWQQPAFMGGTIPPPGGGGNPPPPPPPTGGKVDLTPVLDQIAGLRSEVAGLTNQLAQVMMRLELAVQAAQEARHAAQESVGRIDRAHADVLVAIDVGRQMMATEYRGGVLGFPITLRPVRP